MKKNGGSKRVEENVNIEEMKFTLRNDYAFKNSVIHVDVPSTKST